MIENKFAALVGLYFIPRLLKLLVQQFFIVLLRKLHNIFPSSDSCLTIWKHHSEDELGFHVIISSSRHVCRPVWKPSQLSEHFLVNDEWSTFNFRFREHIRIISIQSSFSWNFLQSYFLRIGFLEVRLWLFKSDGSSLFIRILVSWGSFDCRNWRSFLELGVLEL